MQISCNNKLDLRSVYPYIDVLLQNQVDKYGGIDNLISELKYWGINNVCIKYHEGSIPIGEGVNYRDAFLKYVKNFDLCYKNLMLKPFLGNTNYIK